ncbi:MAG: DUF2855 family protein [Proteobacteria bacterium]|nr:DUF2855 family protein [Pseudomonadota bacterium]
MADQSLDFIVNRKDFSQARFVESALPEPAPGRVLLRVDRFALTANNISYALVGDMLGYWKFFPTAEQGWGRLPVMGFADVVASQHPEVAVGERVFGFFPMSTYLSVEASAVTQSQFVDGAAHREDTAPAYRQYVRISNDANHRPEHEDAYMLLRGLFLTSFLVDDFMADQDFFGAETFVIASASSKTAIALGHLLHAREGSHVVGLTSPRNTAFVEGLGCYHQVLTYDQVSSLPAETPAVFVDMAGDGGVVSAIHNHYGEQLKYSCVVGATHWDAGARSEDLPGPTPTMFFAPFQLEKRRKEWGAAGRDQRMGASWARFREWSESWLKIVRRSGREDLERVYQDTLNGRIPPSEGQILSL